MGEPHYIEVKNLVKNYDTGKVKVRAADHVNFYVEQGEFIGIMGASGSGKTTILNILSAIDTMSEGQVIYDGEDMSGMNEEGLADFRKKCRTYGLFERRNRQHGQGDIGTFTDQRHYGKIFVRSVGRAKTESGLRKSDCQSSEIDSRGRTDGSFGFKILRHAASHITDHE